MKLGSYSLELAQILRKHERILIGVGLTLLIMAHIGASMYWVAVDNHPITADEARHLISARNHYDILVNSEKSLIKRIVEVLNIADIYPPLAHTFGAVAMIIGNRTTDSATMAMLFAQALAIMGIWLIARSLWAPRQALIGTIIVSLLPLFSSSSRYFSTDYLEAALVIWALAALIRTNGFRNTGWSYLFALFSGFGMLARQTALLHCFGPAAFTAIGGFCGAIIAYRKDRSLEFRTVITNTALVVSLCVLLPAIWYLPQYTTMEQFWGRRFDKPDDFYPAGLWLSHPLGLINGGTFLIPFALGCVGVLLAPRFARKRWPLFILGFYVFYHYFVFTWIVHALLIRYLIVFSVIFGFFIYVPISLIRHQKLRAASSLVLIMLMLFNYMNFLFGPLSLLSSFVVPVSSRPPIMKRMHQRGVAVFTDHIIGGAYSFYPPYRGKNWKDRLFERMEEHEIEKHYVTGRRALYQLVDIGSLGMELSQVDYWPRANPFVNDSKVEADAVSPFVNLRDKPMPPQVHLTIQGEEQSQHRKFKAGDELKVKFEDARYIDLEFLSPQEFAALALQFASAAQSPQAYTVCFFDLNGKQCLPVIHQGGAQRAYHFIQFDPRTITRVRIELCEAAKSGGPVQLDQVDFFARIPQPRPLYYFASLHEGETFFERLELAHYVAVREPDGAQLRASEPYLRLDRVLSADFDLLDEFHEPTYGNWEAARIRLYARNQITPINFWTNSRFHVDVSGAMPGKGRWDIPWWGFPSYAPGDTANLQFWASSVPAIMDANLGAISKVYAIELVPLTEKDGFSKRRILFWDISKGAWAEVPNGLLYTSPPRYSNAYPERRPPRPSDTFIKTDRIRFLFEEGASANPQTVVLANAYVYGEPVQDLAANESVTVEKAVEALFSRRAVSLASLLRGLDVSSDLDSLAEVAQESGGNNLLVSFDAVGHGDGVILLLWENQGLLGFPNAAPYTGLWSGDNVVLACRYNEREGHASYRIHFWGDLAQRVRDANGNKLGFRLQSNLKGSSFHLLEAAH